jgi:hypothetical protein
VHTCHPKLCGRLRSGSFQFQANPREKAVTSHLNGKKLGVMAHACHPSYGRKCKIGGSQSMPDWAINKTLSPKLSEQKGLEAWLKW